VPGLVQRTCSLAKFGRPSAAAQHRQESAAVTPPAGAPVSPMRAMRRQGRNDPTAGMGWAADAGAGVGKPLGRSGAHLICSELAVHLVQSLQPLRPCW
jgi:hypothetical protein